MGAAQTNKNAAYLIVSDMHICDVEDNADGWKQYKSSRYVFDEEFSELLAEFQEQAAPGAELVTVLNGDIFDFDLLDHIPEDPPWPVRRVEHRRGLDPTSKKGVWKINRILDHHPLFIRSLAEFLAAGHRAVYVLGNHDRELHFTEVQEALRTRLAAEVKALTGEELPAERFIVERWFYYEAGRIYAEHGQQYDRFSSFRYVLSPVVKDKGGEEHLAVPMGNLSCRYLINKMGFFNPHASDFLLSLFKYLAHWARHYLFTRRSLVFNWAWGSIIVMFHTLSIRGKVRKRGPAAHENARSAVAKRIGIPLKTVVQIDGLQIPPVADRLFRLARELWLDRVLIAGLMTGATIAIALSPIALWIKLMVPLSSFPLIYLMYEALVQEDTYSDAARMPEKARKISELLDCSVVAFGHTHSPSAVPLARKCTLVNTGTWTPSWDEEPDQLHPGKQNYAVVRFTGEEVEVTIHSWMSHAERLEAEAEIMIGTAEGETISVDTTSPAPPASSAEAEASPTPG